MTTINCDNCDKLVNEEELIEIRKGLNVCNSCADEYYALEIARKHPNQSKL
ncbi:MAG: hypothetical protein PHD43_23355 [Methylococcales bacterium]|nr:hypothetical protein [Candidatus Paceibacterota bacterium]MDD5323486.1 hypothetical protein [Methylococcales bacterium]